MFYAQINIATRIVVAETMTHSPIEAEHMIEITEEQFGTTLHKRHDEATGVFTAPTAPPVRVLRKVAYLKRMTQAERIAIRAAGATNPVVNDYIELMNAVTDVVHLDDLDTAAGVHALEAVGLLAAGRAAEILA